MSHNVRRAKRRQSQAVKETNKRLFQLRTLEDLLKIESVRYTVINLRAVF
jgi:hypothetical protein